MLQEVETIYVFNHHIFLQADYALQSCYILHTMSGLRTQRLIIVVINTISHWHIMPTVANR